MLTHRINLYGFLISAFSILFYCYEYLLRIEPSLMMPQLISYFHLSEAGLGGLVALYYFAYTPMQMITGISIDYFGPRKILVFALLFCITGCLLFGNSINFVTAGIGRFLMGLGSSFAFISALKIASYWLPIRYFDLFVGLLSASAMLMAMIGDIILCRLLEHFNWHSLLILSSIIGVFLLMVLCFDIRNQNRSAQWKTHDPLNFKHLLHHFGILIRNPQMWLLGMIGCSMMLSLSVFAETWGISFLRTYHSANNQQASELNSFIFLGWLIGSPLAGIIAGKLKSHRLILFFGCLLAALDFSLILYIEIRSVKLLSGLLFLFGFFSSAQIIAYAIIRNKISTKIAATAFAFFNFQVMLGGMIVQPLIGLILDINWGGSVDHGIRLYSKFEHHIAMSIIPASLLIASVLVIFLKETYNPYPSKTPASAKS